MLNQLLGHLPAGLMENRLASHIAGLQQKYHLPLAIELWSGQRFEFAPAPRATLRVNSPQALPALQTPTLSALGEAYVEGLLDFSGDINDLIALATELSIQGGASEASPSPRSAHSRALDAESIQHHYDVSNEFYELWLDQAMVYSCAYYRHPEERLEDAQMQKIDHILRKIRLQPGQTLLDIGCGWGALVLRAAQHFGARCVGVTLSHNQFELATERVRKAGLQDRIEIRMQDYRDIPERFDRITSVGMFEHVGLANLRSYFGRIRELLKDDGVAMNHGITSSAHDSAGSPFGGGEFIDRYVFPNGELPHIGLALQEISAAGLEATDIENLRLHYALTLKEWSRRFEANLERLRELAGEKRFRVWRAYLPGCALAFEQNWVALHQIVMTRPATLAHPVLPLTREYMYP